jgi:hypothetical protein
MGTVITMASSHVIEICSLHGGLGRSQIVDQPDSWRCRVVIVTGYSNCDKYTHVYDSKLELETLVGLSIATKLERTVFQHQQG